MINIAGLRNFKDRSELSLLADLKYRVAVEIEASPWSYGESNKTRELKRNFDHHINKFLTHLDKIFELIDTEYREVKPQEINKLANRMNRSLYSAYRALAKVQGKYDCEVEMWDSYQIARDIYYKEIRPNALSWEDLDLPYLPVFAESQKDGKTFIAQEATCRENYLKALLDTLRNFIDLESNNTNIRFYSQALHDEICKLAYASTTRVSKTSSTENKNTSLDDFANRFNRFCSHKYSSRDINLAIQGLKLKYDIYQTLVAESLYRIEGQAKGYHNHPKGKLNPSVSAITSLLIDFCLRRLHDMSDKDFNSRLRLPKDSSNLGLRSRLKAYMQYRSEFGKARSFENSTDFQNFDKNFNTILLDLENRYKKSKAKSMAENSLSEKDKEKGLAFGVELKLIDRFNMLVKKKSLRLKLLYDQAIKIIKRVYSYTKLKCEKRFLDPALNFIQKVNSLTYKRVFEGFI